MAKKPSNNLLHGAAKITHALKKYGNGHSMAAGLERYGNEQRQAGRREAIEALQNLSLTERIFGKRIKF